jgi:hypothetical protein
MPMDSRLPLKRGHCSGINISHMEQMDAGTSLERLRLRILYELSTVLENYRVISPSIDFDDTVFSGGRV